MVGHSVMRHLSGHTTNVSRAAESDSDSEIDSYSNRGQKLKKRARFAHKGQLVPTNGPSSYREVAFALMMPVSETSPADRHEVC